MTNVFNIFFFYLYSKINDFIKIIIARLASNGFWIKAQTKLNDMNFIGIILRIQRISSDNI